MLRRLCAAAAAVAVFAGCHTGRGHAALAEPAPHLRAYRSAPSNVPAHVQTAAYLVTRQQAAADPQEFAPYVTWAYPLTSNFSKTQRAGIKTVLYVNPLMPEPGNRFEFKRSQELAVNARDCNGNPVRTYAGTSYLLDVREPGAAQFVRETVDSYIDRIASYAPSGPAPVDLIFVDNANSFYGVSAMPCTFNAAAWTDALDAALAGTKYPLVLNTLSTSAARVPEKVRAIAGRNVVGLMYEHCFLDRQWSAEEIAQIDTIALLRKLHKAPGPGFWCYVNGELSRNEASTVTTQRLFQYASFLLTYDPAYSVYQTAYQSPPSTFAVLPETQFVPMDPQIPVADLDDLRTSGGAYVQKFQYCYYRHKLVGACMVAVNPGTSPVDVPVTGYTRSMVLSGNGVLDGGEVRFTAKPTPTLQPQTGAILLK